MGQLGHRLSIHPIDPRSAKTKVQGVFNLIRSIIHMNRMVDGGKSVQGEAGTQGEAGPSGPQFIERSGGAGGLMDVLSSVMKKPTAEEARAACEVCHQEMVSMERPEKEGVPADAGKEDELKTTKAHFSEPGPPPSRTAHFTLAVTHCGETDIGADPETRARKEKADVIPKESPSFPAFPWAKAKGKQPESPFISLIESRRHAVSIIRNCPWL
jgi:hypothetical protein